MRTLSILPRRFSLTSHSASSRYGLVRTYFYTLLAVNPVLELLIHCVLPTQIAWRMISIGWQTDAAASQPIANRGPRDFRVRITLWLIELMEKACQILLRLTGWWDILERIA